MWTAVKIVPNEKEGAAKDDFVPLNIILIPIQQQIILANDVAFKVRFLHFLFKIV